MVDTDWREILSFSQRELMQADKEKLCESLSWMEADDIELNFTDLKSLFRLSQDILKYKSEQVNNLRGELETAQRKSGKGKTKSSYVDSPKSTDSALETIAHQEEVIKANKDILEQLYADIAELEGRKNNLEEDKNNDKDSESSRDALSEMEAVAQLENEVTLKNRHIRKLLSDVKVLEEENTKMKEKLSVLKDKLTEATQLIENLTEQLFSINAENNKFKEILGNSEQGKAQLSAEIETLRKELFEKDSNRENIYEEIKSKVQHWKNVVRTKKSEIDALTNENTRLKEDLFHVSQPSSSPKIKRNKLHELKIKELQDKLTEASNEIIQSANLIELARSENKKLRSVIEETPEFSVSDARNESDEGKERIIINKLKRKNKSLVVALQGAEEMIAVREKELTEITSQLKLLKSDEGIDTIFEGLKNKKRQLKFKDDEIKKLVQEVNALNQTISGLQLENETMRHKLNIPADDKIPIKGILKTYRKLEHDNIQMVKDHRKTENILVNMELENRQLNIKIIKLTKLLTEMGCSAAKLSEVFQSIDDNIDEPMEDGGEASAVLNNYKHPKSETVIYDTKMAAEMEELSEENEGLRKGLQEILNFLKDNSTTSSGVLALQCPSLEAILQSMEARHAAGWVAPHMAALMELKTALGGKDALLVALNEARKEMFEVMTQLSKESRKTVELEKKLHDVESKSKSEKENAEGSTFDTTIRNTGEFGSWMADKEQNNIDFYDSNQIGNLILKANVMYEEKLKHGLIYFHTKFKALFNKLTTIAIQAADDKNQWSIQEEDYKAQIENLNSQIYQINDDETSDISPGLINTPNIGSLQRKCYYLEESFKYIRTLNENIKTECLESKKDAMIAASEYEAEIQMLILCVANLTDKLRGSISLEIFWKQNEALNETVSKYRKVINEGFKKQNESTDFYKRLENDKLEIVSLFQKEYLQTETKESEHNIKSILANIEQSVFSKQLQQVCIELDNKNKQIENLELHNSELQKSLSILIDRSLSSMIKEDIDLMKDSLEKIAEDNKLLKEQCQHVESQLDIALLQLQDSQQRHMDNDLEINMLRHQILDLQSAGDNKAIIARLSGEVLVAHLQASESHKKIERLNSALNKEKERKVEAEEMLKSRQKIFDVYAFRYESKFKYMHEVMQVFRQEYQGSLPLTSIESYLNNIEELSHKTHDVNEKLDEIEDLRSSLMTKHSVFNQILDVSRSKCFDDQDSCPHKLQNIVMQGIHSRELEQSNIKVKTLEQSREKLLNRCNYLDRTLLHVNQGFEKTYLNDMVERRNSVVDHHAPNLELEDVLSDDEPGSKRSQTITLPKPQVLKSPKNYVDMSTIRKGDATDRLDTSLINVPQQKQMFSVAVQANPIETKKINKSSQTDYNTNEKNFNRTISILKDELNKKNIELTELVKLSQLKTEEVLTLNTEKIKLDAVIHTLKESRSQSDILNDKLHNTVDDLKIQIADYRKMCSTNRVKARDTVDDDNKSLILALKQLETDKNAIVAEYKQLLNKERESYSKSMKDLQTKTMELQTQLDRRGSDNSASNAEALKEVISKYTLKVSELEDKCFKTQSELDGCKADLTTYQSEVDRWKTLASERLTKMEHLNSQLEERHCHEVNSYKAENDHWLAQLNEAQREHMELRARFSEQKASYIKQLSEKDAHIEHLRSVVHNLKTQVMSMQTMISVSDPSFDLSAIVEVDEASDGLSQPSSERLELKFDSTIDLRDMPDDVVRMSGTSTTVWQEPIIERLRREKQLTGKQNAILRRQIKALAARERRARLDAQNLKNQVFRISTSGSKAATAESASLQTKIATLQAQLMSARRDTNSTIAIWDKWKRAQQSSDRWQARFEDKCQEVKKLESSLGLAKSSVARLEKEKRTLLTRLAEIRSDRQSIIEEKHDGERPEKARTPSDYAYSDREPPVSARALLDRVQAQQRRIAALEVAEKGNEHLVNEYEKSLAEMTSLKGQVLKLESALLESQIRSPLKPGHDPQPELDHWKSYCEMLKEENVQLTLKANSAESAPTASSAHHRVNDLEQTVLTLRGLVSKLQSEQKSGAVHKRPESRPSSGLSTTEKGRTQLESHRLEVANLKRSIHDKDLLLERSKEMLKIAAEREDDLLRENGYLRRQLNEFTKHRGGFLSA